MHAIADYEYGEHVSQSILEILGLYLISSEMRTQT